MLRAFTTLATFLTVFTTTYDKVRKDFDTTVELYRNLL